MLPFVGKGYTISCPATSSNPNGFDWVKQWASQCPECINSCDTMSAHWYDVREADLETYIEKWHDGFGKNILLTEFACQVRISALGDHLGTLTAYMHVEFQWWCPAQ